MATIEQQERIIYVEELLMKESLTSNDILQKLKMRGYSVDLRTVQNYLKFLLDNGAPLVKSGHYYSYSEPHPVAKTLSLDTQDEFRLQFAYSFLKQFTGALFEDALKALEKVANDNYIDLLENGNPHFIYSELGNRDGGRWTLSIYKAIKKQRKMRIRNKRDNMQVEEHIISPARLRGSGNVYILDALTDQKKFRHFHLAEILTLEILDEKSEIEGQFTEESVYGYSLPLNLKKECIHDVLLAFTGSAKREIMNYPLHSSQRIEESTEEMLIVKLSIYLDLQDDSSRHLLRDLMKYGKEVKVLQPVFLQEKIQQLHQEALSGYSRLI